MLELFQMKQLLLELALQLAPTQELALVLLQVGLQEQP